MIPKAILYGSRAASHAHGQAVNSFRNVLQLPPVVNPSTSSNTILNVPGVASSSWGAGGQSYTYQGYTGAGRAITQANQTATNDNSRDQSDDSDERIAALVPYAKSSAPSPRSAIRPRRHSLTTGARPARRVNELGVLQVVQLHIRVNRSFGTESASRPSEDAATATSTSAPRPLSRRHSTSASTVLQSNGSPDSLPPSRPFLENPPSSGSQSRPSPPQSTGQSREYNQLKSAIKDVDRERIIALVQQFQNSNSSSPGMWNLALTGLLTIRQPDEPLTVILELYNEMLRHNVVPALPTYRLMIDVLLQRDYEVYVMLQSATKQAWRRDHGATNSDGYYGTHPSQIEDLRQERNYESALALFEACNQAFANPFTPTILNKLLRAAAFRGDVDNALRIFARFEAGNTIKPDLFTYHHLLEAYRAAGDLESAREIFADFVAQVERGQINWEAGIAPLSLVWERMISIYIGLGHPESALELLETMLDKGSPEGPIPLPTASTYSNIITAFTRVGDYESALIWYRRINDPSFVLVDPVTTKPIRPVFVQWEALFNSIPDINLLNDFIEESVLGPHPINLRNVDITFWTVRVRSALTQSDDDQQRRLIARFSQLLPPILSGAIRSNPVPINREAVTSIIQRAVEIDMIPEAVALFKSVALNQHEGMLILDADTNHPRYRIFLAWYQAGVNDIATRLQSRGSDPAAFEMLLTLLESNRETGLESGGSAYAALVGLYQGGAKLSVAGWGILASAFCDAELTARERSIPPPPFESFLVDLVQAQTPEILAEVDLQRVQHVLSLTRGPEEANALLRDFGNIIPPLSIVPAPPSPVASVTTASGFESAETASLASAPASSTGTSIDAYPSVHIDRIHSRFVDEHSQPHTSVTPALCFNRYLDGAARGVFPNPEVIARLINGLGRVHEIEKVHKLYADAQHVLASLEYDKTKQTRGWFRVEDNMIAALSHAGQPEAANEHRIRIIQQGGAPSADAYGALIAAAKDTTDDSSIALELFEESVRLNVVPNVYLYNTIISRLSRARKAEYALELFHRMPYIGLRPSAVTYGAAIAACCRVGDEASAKFLFDEMFTLPNYRPRVPSFNMMIQFFVAQKKDRSQAVHYYELLLKHGLRPTAHTYKLLLDAYGSIDPIDTAALDATFQEASSHGMIQGTHWAAMITAFGVVHKDLDRALEVFNSIGSLSGANVNRPDAIVYEALFSSIFAAKRADLIPQYYERMQRDSVHMTAYIANILIAGHANAGDIEQSRRIFESLVDPPVGIAAPGNHVAPDTPTVVPASITYREPSSYEAIIRAELSEGDRTRIPMYLRMLEQRSYPAGVTSRIRAIVDEVNAVDALGAAQL